MNRFCNRGAILKLLKHSPLRQYSSAVTLDDQIDCWSCNHRHNFELLCPKCSSVQCTECTTKKLNFFQVLKNDVNFDISIETIKQHYLKLQTMLHPDRYTNSSKKERDYSNTQSALVNQAYKTLGDPLKRGLYMLSLHGYEVDSEIVESSDSKLLNEIFMMNFEVDECEERNEILELQERISRLIETDKSEISKAFQRAELEKAREALIRLKYRTNIKFKVDEKLFEMS